MIDPRDKWNAKYREGRRSPLHSTLVRFYHLAPKGRALEIACGTGENAFFLAKKGFKVEAFDISDVAIRIARKRARREGLRLKLKSVDALKFSFPPNRYGLILNFYFLERRVLPKIKRSLISGGLLIFETYNEEHIAVNPDFNRNYLLKKGELLDSFRDFEVLYYSEISNITTLIARKP